MQKNLQKMRGIVANPEVAAVKDTGAVELFQQRLFKLNNNANNNNASRSLGCR